ncbi:MAG: hypothetical protein ACRDJI_02540, partial [Actinomycetota bacterium]
MPGPTADDRAAIQELLDARADAVMDGDRKAFLSSVAKLSHAFYERQRRLFDWMSSVPFAAYELQADWDRQGDLIRPSDAARYPAPEAATIPVTEERYRIAAFD